MHTYYSQIENHLDALNIPIHLPYCSTLYCVDICHLSPSAAVKCAAEQQHTSDNIDSKVFKDHVFPSADKVTFELIPNLSLHG